ncbi:hypothetical protein [Candidatus Mycoplasma haematohominis]|uniref:Uncharacterized protein n=1 Tax=Candidatus Mycoplasma haematohominis TaxID=1494318 RepID=A0A478FQH1_9MOLU|nr:hypothetical protein [Candidatus Mycoplasma haemohominis]GCE63741.1 hypothetical protein MHSWG343_07410 [Candidatus Mycoplasma haemohominis]
MAPGEIVALIIGLIAFSLPAYNGCMWLIKYKNRSRDKENENPDYREGSKAKEPGAINKVMVYWFSGRWLTNIKYKWSQLMRKIRRY